VAGNGMPLWDCSKIDVVSIFCLPKFLREQSFEAAILAGAKILEIPQWHAVAVHHLCGVTASNGARSRVCANV
jgi:hypothetical protein